jgi:hypothetical protein
MYFKQVTSLCRYDTTRKSICPLEPLKWFRGGRDAAGSIQ